VELSGSSPLWAVVLEMLSLRVLLPDRWCSVLPNWGFKWWFVLVPWISFNHIQLHRFLSNTKDKKNRFNYIGL